MGVSSIGLGSGAHATRKAYYTGYQMDGTTAIDQDLQVGDFVCWTFGQTFTVAGVTKQAQGYHVTRPQTSILRLPAGVVHSVPAGSVRGGLVTLVTSADRINALCDADATIGVTYLGPQNGSFALAAKTAISALDDLGEVAALALETADTDTTNALKPVKLGNLFGCVNQAQ